MAYSIFIGRIMMQGTSRLFAPSPSPRRPKKIGAPAEKNLRTRRKKLTTRPKNAGAGTGAHRGLPGSPPYTDHHAGVPALLHFSRARLRRNS